MTYSNSTTHIEKCTYKIYSSVRPKASDRESIVNSVKAGLLTCNGFRHPSRFWQWICKDETFDMLLTVARQFVILTRFPINLP